MLSHMVVLFLFVFYLFLYSFILFFIFIFSYARSLLLYVYVFSLIVASGGYTLVAVQRLLIGVVSPVLEHRL